MPAAAVVVMPVHPVTGLLVVVGCDRSGGLALRRDAGRVLIRRLLAAGVGSSPRRSRGEMAMYARKTAFRTSADNVETAGTVFTDEVLPLARNIPGFKGAVAMADRSTGDLVAYTLWETEDAMSTSEEQANQIRAESIQKIGALGPPDVQRYEVLIWEV
jgi:heme-degrading monooxygenase HmoA